MNIEITIGKTIYHRSSHTYTANRTLIRHCQKKMMLPHGPIGANKYALKYTHTHRDADIRNTTIIDTVSARVLSK